MVSPYHLLDAGPRLSDHPANTQPGRSSRRRGQRGKKSVDPLPIPDALSQPLGLQTTTGAGLPTLVPLSLAEVRRLFWALLLSRPLSFPFRLAWSFFRRAHQALARRCHYKRRLASLSQLPL